MASQSPPISRCASPAPADWDFHNTAHDMSCWDLSYFKAHISKTILQQLSNNRDHADFEIHCANHKMKVHKPMLRAHSEVLAKACDNSSFKEAVSGILTLKSDPCEGDLDNLGDGDDPEIVKEMIHYFYHLELSPKARAISPRPRKGARVELSLVYLARVYVLAEKYFIGGLKVTVMTEFRGSLRRNLFHPEFVESCLIIYKKTVEPAGERGLKTVIANVLAGQLEKVMGSQMLEELFQEIPALALCVLREVPKQYTGCASYPSSRRSSQLSGLFD
ncbi:hypothetical protein KCU79_g7480, partial [Aureobasidium melanogenum]